MLLNIYLTKLDVLKLEFPRHYLELTTCLLVFRKYPSNMKLHQKLIRTISVDRNITSKAEFI